MLSDLVAASLQEGYLKVLVKDSAYEDCYTDIMAAHRFSFTNESSDLIRAMLPEESSSNNERAFLKYFREIEKVIEIFAAPFQSLWIELPVKAPDVASAVDKLRIDAPRVKKVGFLVRCSKNGKKGEILLFWQYRVPQEGVEVGMSMASTTFNFEDGLSIIAEDVHQREVADSVGQKPGVNLLYPLRKRFGICYDGFKQGWLTNEHRRSAAFDWLGETDVLFWAIVTINSRNGFSKQVIEPDPKLQKARIKKGKLPILTYTVLDLSDQNKRSLSTNSGGSDRRLHWRRGHFKARASGVYWWAAHMAGNKRLGEVVKDYSL